jgi:hypothetical protein
MSKKESSPWQANECEGDRSVSDDPLDHFDTSRQVYLDDDLDDHARFLAGDWLK